MSDNFDYDTDKSKEPRPVGIYGGGRIPGTYLKTRTGVVRGEELFSRPDLERPWRSAGEQQHALDIALKEKEIEELMRLCSKLRTELGNAKSDTRFVEYSITERFKAELGGRDKEICELQSRVTALEKEKSDIVEETEHQIRLAKSQREADIAKYQNEARLANERCVELAKSFQKQIDDVKAAGAREVTFVESRFKARADELSAELQTVRQSVTSTEEHYKQQIAESQNMIHRVETDFKERLQSSEQRAADYRKSAEAQLEKERREKSAALEEARRCTEQLALALTDRNEMLVKDKHWNKYIQSGLEELFMRVVESFPDAISEPLETKIHDEVAAHAPRAIVENPEGRLSAEVIVKRLLQFKKVDFPYFAGGRSDDASESAAAAIERLNEQQERLRAAVREVREKCIEMDSSMATTLSRLYFFSDNLEDCLEKAPRVQPPERNVVFVCLAVEKGNQLWVDDPESMRTAVTLLHNTVRTKMSQYGAYECHSDTVSFLLAFEDATAACRFCTESQVWLMKLPWPAAVLSSIHCPERKGQDGATIFRGPRVCMAMHAGEVFMEKAGIPCSNDYRAHYYGRAVSQILHICALAQGGQVLASRAAWQQCLRRRHELGEVSVTEIGPFPIISFNSESGLKEKQTVELFQIAPGQLTGRTFQSTAHHSEDHGSSLTGVRASILSLEIEALHERRRTLQGAIEVVGEELSNVQTDVSALVSRVGGSKTHFHLLSPPDMVAQLNDIYSIIEMVAVRAEEMQAELTELTSAQDEIALQTKGLSEYYRQHAKAEAREDDLRTEIAVASSRMEKTLAETHTRHRHDIEKLQLTLQEREQAIRRMFQTTQRK